MKKAIRTVAMLISAVLAGSAARAEEGVCAGRVVLAEGSELRVVARPVAAVPELVRIGDVVATSADPALSVLRNDRETLIFQARGDEALIAFPVAGRATLIKLVALDSESITGTLTGAPRPPRIPLAALERIELLNGDQWIGVAVGPVRGSAHGVRLTGDSRVVSTPPMDPLEIVALRPHVRVSVSPRLAAPRSATRPPQGRCGPPSPLGVTVLERGEGQVALACPGQFHPVKGTLLGMTDAHWRVKRDDTGDVVEVPRQPELAARTECDGRWLLVADDARFEP
jgi:hypothetical protein